MILGLGIDLVELARIQKIYTTFGDQFAQKLLHPSELDIFPRYARASANRAVTYLASRFAAKEAAVKALGTGFSQGIWFHDLSVVSNESGAPQLLLYNKAAERADLLGATRTHISITHSQNTAGAVVILEK